MPKVTEADRFRHRLDAAEPAIGFSRGRTRQDFHQDRQLLFAATRCIEIIGEVASLISPATRAKHGEI